MLLIASSGLLAAGLLVLADWAENILIAPRYARQSQYWASVLSAPEIPEFAEWPMEGARGLNFDMDDEDDAGDARRGDDESALLDASSDWDEGSTVLSSPRSTMRDSLGSVTQITDMREGSGGAAGAGDDENELLVEDL